MFLYLCFLGAQVEKGGQEFYVDFQEAVGSQHGRVSVKAMSPEIKAQKFIEIGCQNSLYLNITYGRISFYITCWHSHGLSESLLSSFELLHVQLAKIVRMWVYVPCATVPLTCLVCKESFVRQMPWLLVSML